MKQIFASLIICSFSLSSLADTFRPATAVSLVCDGTAEQKPNIKVIISSKPDDRTHVIYWADGTFATGLHTDKKPSLKSEGDAFLTLDTDDYSLMLSGEDLFKPLYGKKSDVNVTGYLGIRAIPADYVVTCKGTVE